LGCAFFWAFAVVLFRKSGERVPPVALNAFKGAIAIVLFAPTLLVLGRPFFTAPYGAREWLTLLASGALGIGIADTLFFASLNRLGATGSAVVDCVYGPFVVLAAFLYLGEPLRPSLLAAVTLMASAILIGFHERADASAGRSRAGVVLGVVSMLLMAVGIVIAKPVLDASDIWWATPVRLIGGELVLLAVAAVSRQQREAMLRALIPGRHWAAALPSALLGSYLAMVMWIAGMKLTRASVAGILNQTSTLIVPLLAAPFLGERLTARKGIAIALGFVGALVAAL
jgi:drug/metabolite transporter (DMT)-like permease